MKNILVLASVLASTFGVLSCGRGSLGREVEAFVGQRVVFPDSLQAVVGGRTVENLGLTDSAAKLVVWIDSIGCTSCALQHLDPWYEVTDYAGQVGQGFQVVFLLSPKRADRNTIGRSTTLFRYPMYVDRESRFEALNPAVPKDSRLHVFLLDSANRVVLVGSPIGNPRLWELYKQQIEKLTGR